MRVLIPGILFLVFSLPAQRPFHFFDPGNLVTIQGTVQRIDVEDVYGKKSKFVVLTVLSTDQKTFRVEIGPQWFLENDIAAGMKIGIHGSLISETEGTFYLIAQEISFQGERILLRDRKGFPLWSQRGAQEGGGKRSGRGRRGK